MSEQSSQARIAKTAGAKYILAIDHGTSGCKTALAGLDGEILGFEFEATPIQLLPGSGAEQDPEDWWQALIKTCRRLVEKQIVPVEDIVAMCCSSTYSSTVAVDAQGMHLAPCLTWLDARGAGYVQDLMRGLINIKGYSIFNILRFLSKTGGAPTLSGKDDIAHVLFWKHECPQIYQAAHMFLGSKDYLNARLTGKLAASQDSMTLFWVTDNRNINEIKYDRGLIDKLQIDAGKLPPIMSSVDVLGELLPKVASQIGLRSGVKVVVGSPDLQSATIGSGAVNDFQGHVYIGTSSWLLCHVPYKKTDMWHTLASLPAAIPGRYFCANEQDLAGGCLTFLRDNLLYHQDPLNSRQAPQNAYQLFDQIVEKVPAGSNKIIFTPWLNGEKTPVDDHLLGGGFHNISLDADRAQLIRAVYEGVAYNSRWVLKYVEKFIGREMQTLNIIGGGAQSDVWCQIFADVLDCRIKRVKDPLFANARGAAYIAAVALGYIEFSDIPELTEIEQVFSPEPENRKMYTELFEVFLQIHKYNKSIYHGLNRAK
ncbi:MAG: FGGY-family carbohydrate kinase [Deltaproteobacteria bacterium]|nr:FGGY-family carbohydrate kinase [Deltaproteobacteria bacterium]